MASVGHQAAGHGKLHGNFREFSRFFHYRLTRKAYFIGFSGRAARKSRHATGVSAPTALRPRATCPTCHNGICKDSLPPFVTSDRPLSPATARLLHCHPITMKKATHPRSLASVTCHSCLSHHTGVGIALSMMEYR